MVFPLTLVRQTTVYPVPDVCSVFWTPEDWQRVARVVTEPLVLDALGATWIATGNRDDRSRLLYRLGSR